MVRFHRRSICEDVCVDRQCRHYNNLNDLGLIKPNTYPDGSSRPLNPGPGGRYSRGHTSTQNHPFSRGHPAFGHTGLNVIGRGGKPTLCTRSGKTVYWVLIGRHMVAVLCKSLSFQEIRERLQITKSRVNILGIPTWRVKSAGLLCNSVHSQYSRHDISGLTSV